MNYPVQFDKPLFVKVDQITSAGKIYKRGALFDWQTKEVPKEKIMIMYNQGMLYHNEELESKQKTIGDGLDALTIDELHALKDSINAKVKKAAKNKTEAEKKKCPHSTIPDKQRGHIRRWRSLYGELENIE